MNYANPHLCIHMTSAATLNVGLPSGFVGPPPSSDNNPWRQDQRDTDSYSGVNAHVILISREDEERSTVQDDLSPAFSLTNKFLRYYEANFILVALLILVIMGEYAMLWVFILEYTFIKEIFATRDIPGSFAIVSLVIALIYGDLIRQSLSAYQGPPEQLHGILHEISQIARKFNTHVHLPLKMRCDKECKPTVSSLDVRRMISAFIDAPMEVCKAMAYHSLQLYSSASEMFNPPYAPELQQRVKSWNLLDHNRIPEAIEVLIGIHEGIVTEAVMCNALSTGGVSEIRTHQKTLRDRIAEFKKARAIHIPDIFYGVLHAVLGFYVLFVLPISMYDSVDVYMPISYAMVLFMIFGPVFFRWWVGDAFDADPRYIGMPFNLWRARTNIKIVAEQVAMHGTWMHYAGYGPAPDIDAIIRNSVGRFDTNLTRMREDGRKYAAVLKQKLETRMRLSDSMV